MLYEHGGIYVDLDTESLHPIHPITEQYSCILAQEPFEHAHFLGPLGKIHNTPASGVKKQFTFFQSSRQQACDIG